MNTVKIESCCFSALHWRFSDGSGSRTQMPRWKSYRGPDSIHN